MSNFMNRKAKFGQPLFTQTSTAGLSEARSCIGAERLYLFAVGAGGKVAQVRIWGLVRIEMPSDYDTTVAPTTLAPTSVAPTTDPAALATERWVLSGSATLTIPASEVNAPQSFLNEGVRSPLVAVDIQAFTKYRVELVSATGEVTIWGATTEVSV